MKKQPPKKRRLKKDREFQPSHVTKTGLGWFEMNERGSFRIVVEDAAGKLHRSYPTFYEDIATLEADGHLYIGVSAYFEGGIPHERVLRVTEEPAP